MYGWYIHWAWCCSEWWRSDFFPKYIDAEENEPVKNESIKGKGKKKIVYNEKHEAEEYDNDDCSTDDEVEGIIFDDNEDDTGLGLDDGFRFADYIPTNGIETLMIEAPSKATTTR